MKKSINTFPVILLLSILVFVVFRKSLGLSLYGDDWLVIAKYWGSYGPGTEFPYYHPRLFFSNYGFQNMTALLYIFFKSNPFPYFVISLVLRTLASFGVYIFVKKILGFKSAIFASSFFAVTVIGAETTDWVYNMNTYLGIFFAILGLYFFVGWKKSSQLFLGVSLCILGYLVVPIRLYLLPAVLLVVELIRQIYLAKKLNIKNLMFAGVKSICVSLLPFLILKQIFPDAGWQPVNSLQIKEGINLGISMLMARRFDFLLYPFTSLGQMMIPVGANQLASLGLQMYPMSKFVFSGGLLGIFGLVIILLSFKSISTKTVQSSFIMSGALLVFLKVFVKYQGRWQLMDFPYFAWTFLGLVFTAALLVLGVRLFLTKKRTAIAVYLIGVIFILSFIFPWLYNPLAIFTSPGRYLIITGLGFALVLTLYFKIGENSANKKYRKLGLFVMLFLFILQITATNTYFTGQLQRRTLALNDKLFSQIQRYVTILPQNGSVFYFEGADPGAYEELLRFGFGYHMHLLYKTPYKEITFPTSVNNLQDLVRELQTKKLDRSGIYGFKVNGDQLIDITPRIRNTVFSDLVTVSVKKDKL